MSALEGNPKDAVDEAKPLAYLEFVNIRRHIEGTCVMNMLKVALPAGNNLQWMRPFFALALIIVVGMIGLQALLIVPNPRADQRDSRSRVADKDPVGHVLNGIEFIQNTAHHTTMNITGISDHVLQDLHNPQSKFKDHNRLLQLMNTVLADNGGSYAGMNKISSTWVRHQRYMAIEEEHALKEIRLLRSGWSSVLGRTFQDVIQPSIAAREKDLVCAIAYTVRSELGNILRQLNEAHPIVVKTNHTMIAVQDAFRQTFYTSGVKWKILTSSQSLYATLGSKDKRWVSGAHSTIRQLLLDLGMGSRYLTGYLDGIEHEIIRLGVLSYAFQCGHEFSNESGNGFVKKSAEFTIIGIVDGALTWHNEIPKARL